MKSIKSNVNILKFPDIITTSGNREQSYFLFIIARRKDKSPSLTLASLSFRLSMPLDGLSL